MHVKEGVVLESETFGTCFKWTFVGRRNVKRWRWCVVGSFGVVVVKDNPRVVAACEDSADILWS